MFRECAPGHKTINAVVRAYIWLQTKRKYVRTDTLCGRPPNV